ncbi:MAG: hypothetical protein IJZ86_06255 [Bacteroides sp.]|nr:hypothetical protein [Bacteroides sp.]
MKNIIKTFSFLLLSVLLLCGCKSSSIYAHRFTEVECMGVELDGSQTLKTYGLGKNKADALEQAKKNAVRAVIFKGIVAGKEGCNMRPLVTEVNAEEKYEEYFNIFFMDGGEYKKYISMKDGKQKNITKSKESVSCSVIVQVLRSELKKRLKEDNVIK